MYKLILLLAFIVVIVDGCKKDDLQPPTITSFTPATGGPGTVVTITGTGFSTTASDNVIKFNGTAAAAAYATATQLTVTVPQGTTSGAITVTAKDGLTGNSTSDFAVLPPSTITSFAPTSDFPTHTVVITGTNFSANISDNQVQFNGRNATITAATTTQLTVTIPKSATTGKITVTVYGSTVTSATDFTVFTPAVPSITSFAPASALEGGTVVITGASFSPQIPDNSVKFNNVNAKIVSATQTQLNVTVPTGATNGNITVTVFGIPVTSTDEFTVLHTPTVSSFTPEFATAGSTTTTVTITGTRFSDNIDDNTVKFNGETATVLSASSTSLVVALPELATTGRITVTVDGLTGTSTKDILIGCADATVTDVQVTNIATDNSFTLTHTVKNIGTIPLQINKMILQQSLGKSLTESDVAVVISFNYSGDDIPPGGTRVFSYKVNTTFGWSLVTYPYVFVNIAHGNNSQVECGGNTDNNEFVRRVQ